MIVKRKPKKRSALNMDLKEFHINKYNWVCQEKSKWNVVTFVSYFCVKYKERYSVEYRFSGWRGNPALTKEGRDLSKILKEYKESGLSKLDANKKLYNYINWSFDYKAKRGVNINSTGLLYNHVFFNEFEKAYHNFLKKARNKVDMTSLKEWCKDNAPSILENYNLESRQDLEFIEKMLTLSDLSGSEEEILIDKAKKEGLL
jgi:hypothetical protein